MALVIFGIANGLFLTVTEPPVKAADCQVWFTVQDYLETVQECATVCEDLLNLMCLMGSASARRYNAVVCCT